MLEVNQHSVGNRIALSTGDLRIWTAKAAPGSHAGSRTCVALFMGENSTDTEVTWAQTGIAWVFGKELWTGVALAPRAGIHVHLAPHASALGGA